MSQVVLNKLRGVNTTRAELLLDPGTSSFSQNVRNRPLDNWVKRNGIEPVTTSASPIMGIFDVELDGIVIPIIQTGGNLTFYPNIESASRPNPSPYPPFDPLDPGGNFVLFLIEPLMRAVQERRLRTGLSKLTWATGSIVAGASSSMNLYFNPDGSLINGQTGVPISDVQNVSSYWAPGTGTAQFPRNNLYEYDLAYYDNYVGQAFGTHAANLINEIRHQMNIILQQVVYGWPPDGYSSVQNLSAAFCGLPSASAATAANYKSVFTSLKSAMRYFIFIKSPAQYVVPPTNYHLDSSDSRSGDQSSGVSCANAQTLAFNQWTAGAWAEVGEKIYSYEGTVNYGPGTYRCLLAGNRGRYYSDLTNYPGNVLIYMIVYPGSLPGTPAATHIAANNPPVTADNLYHLLGVATGGQVVTTSTYGDVTPQQAGVCPAGTGSTNLTYRGWEVQSAQFLIIPNFTNTF